MKTFTLSKILMLTGALWIILFSILAVAKAINITNLYGWKQDPLGIILIGFFYILIPFSTKPGIWSKIWAIGIFLASILIIIGYFIGSGIDYKSVWTYITPLPHIVMTAGAAIWIIQG